MSTSTRPSIIVPVDDPPLPIYPDYDNPVLPTRRPGMSHSEKQNKKEKEEQEEQTIQVNTMTAMTVGPNTGYNNPKNLQAIKYAQLIAAEYDDYYRKYTIVRSADPEMPGNFMIDGDSRTYPSGKKYEGGLFIFLDSDFPGTSGAWDSWASITGGEYDAQHNQYALSLDMSYYGYFGIRISGEYGDKTYFNFKLDSYDNDICKLFDHNGWPTLWYNTLGPKVIYSSLKQLGTLYSLNVSGASTLNSLECTQVNCSGNIFGQDLVGTNVWADYVESSGYVVANTIEATNWIGLPPADILPITLDTTNNRVGINKATPTEALDVTGNALVSGTLTASSLGGTVTTASQPNITSVGTLGGLTVAGNVSQTTGTASLGDLTVPSVSCSGNISGTLTTAAQPNITSVGTLGGLTVAGNVSQTTGTASLGDLTVPSVSCSGNISGTLTTAAQPNITSVGTLSTLNVTGDVTIDSNTIKVDSTNNRVGINTTNPAYALDVTGTSRFTGAMISALVYINPSTTGTKVYLFNSAGNNYGLGVSPGQQNYFAAGSHRFYYGGENDSGTLLLTIANTGNIAQSIGTASFGALTVPSISCSGNISGTLTTAAQPNITSVGTLSTLNVTGDVNIDSNTLRVDSVNNRVGVNTATPTTTLDVNGASTFRGALAQTTGTSSLQSTTVTNLYLRAGGSSDANNLFYLQQAGNYMFIDAKSQTGSLSAAGLSLRTSAAGSNVMSEAFRLEGDATTRLYGNIIQTTTKTATLGGTSTTYLNTGSIRVNSLGSIISSNGTPEGVTTATVGSLYLRGDGAEGTALYIKETGTGNTGWKAVGGSSTPIVYNSSGDVDCPLIPAGSSAGTFYNIRSQSLQAGMYRLSLSGTLSGSNMVSVYFGTVVGAGTIVVQTQSAALTRGAVSGYLTTDGTPKFGSINMLFNVSTTPTDLNFGFQLVSNTTPEIPANTFKINYYYVIEKIA